MQSHAAFDSTRFLENFLSSAFDSVDYSQQPHGLAAFGLSEDDCRLREDESVNMQPLYASFPPPSLQHQEQQQRQRDSAWHPRHDPHLSQNQSEPRQRADSPGFTACSAATEDERELEETITSYDPLDDEGTVRDGGDGRLRAGGGQVVIVKTGRGHLSGMQKMRNDKLREQYLAAEPERRREAELQTQKETRKEQASIVKDLLSQLRDTQALFAASALHAGITSTSLASSQSKTSHLESEIRRLKSALKEEKGERRQREREVEAAREKEREAQSRLMRYSEELKVREARAFGRREGREEALEEISRWAPLAPPPPPTAQPFAPNMGVQPAPVAMLDAVPVQPPSVQAGALQSPLVPDDHIPAISPAAPTVAVPAVVPVAPIPSVPLAPAASAPLAPAASVPLASSILSAQAPAAPPPSIATQPAPDKMSTVTEQERAKLKALIAEILDSSRPPVQEKMPYTPVVIAAPPPTREERRERRPSSTPPIPSSPRPRPPDYRPSPRTPPRSHRRPASDVHHVHAAHHNGQSRSASLDVPRPQVQQPSNDSLFRPATEPRRPPKHQPYDSNASSAVQPFKHNPPSFDLKSPPPALVQPRPRPREDEFASVPGREEARYSRYPPFTDPTGSQAIRAPILGKMGAGEEDVYPRMKWYGPEDVHYEQAQRDLPMLPPSDGSSAAGSIIMSPTSPRTPPALRPQQNADRNRPAKVSSPLSTYGDIHQPQSSAQYERSQPYRPPLHPPALSGPLPRHRPQSVRSSDLSPTLTDAASVLLQLKMPTPLAAPNLSASSAARPHSQFVETSSRSIPARNTFHGQRGWPGLNPLERGDAQDRRSIAPSLIIHPPTQSTSKDPSRKAPSDLLRSAVETSLPPTAVPLPASRALSRSSDDRRKTYYQDPLPVHSLNIRSKTLSTASAVPPIPPKALSRRQTSMDSPPIFKTGGDPPPPLSPGLQPLPSSRPSSAFAPKGRPTSLQPPVPPKDDRWSPFSRDPTPHATTPLPPGMHSARVSTVGSDSSEWFGASGRKARSPPLGSAVDPAAIRLPASRAPSRARTPSLKDSDRGGARTRPRPPTNYDGATVASTIEEVEEEQTTDKSKRRSGPAVREG